MNSVLAILALALTTLVWQPALAAEGSGDEDEPTMAELAAKMDSLSSELGALSATVGNLATLAGTLATATAVQSLAAKVDAHAGRGQQMAVFMTVPYPSSATPPDLFLIGNSTIPGFPPGPISADGRIAQIRCCAANSATLLPAGTYLFELQHPYSNEVQCHGSVPRRNNTSGRKFDLLRHPLCPYIHLVINNATTSRYALRDGPGIFTVDGTHSLIVRHWFPTDFTFTAEKPRTAYIGGVVVTKIK